jgi:hypothetical protein
VLRQSRPWIVCGLEGVKARLRENSSEAPGCRSRGSFIG